MELFNDFWIALLKTSPIVGLLMVGVYYLYKENQELKADNKELNKYVRDSENRNTQILSGVTSTLDKLIEKTNNNTDDLKEWLDLKLQTLKGK